MNQRTYEAAKAVLQDNTYTSLINGKPLRMTLPSKEFYLHQWNWDSATHAMGLVHIDEQRAFEEILFLLSGQWRNGLIPHIIFNPLELAYFPGPDFWKTKYASGIQQATSGITQPPLLAISVEYMYQEAKNRKKANAFLTLILPRLISYHSYLKKSRDPENSGLISIIHPWESGTDNSPRWDEILEAIPLTDIPEHVRKSIHAKRCDHIKGVDNHRPKETDYYRYIYLVDLYKSWDWNYKKILNRSPFVVKDVLVNAIWCRANESLASILEQTGQREEAKRFRKWEKQTRDALQNLWDEKTKIFMTVDVSLGGKRFLKENTVANFLPLYAKAVDEKQLFSLINQLVDPKLYWSPFPFPSTSLSHDKFELTRYWRGPTWPITNLFVIEGLLRYSEYPISRFLGKIVLKKTLRMIEQHGFFEYYHPLLGRDNITKQPLGFGSFSWSAAIYLYLLHEYRLTQTEKPHPDV